MTGSLEDFEARGPYLRRRWTPEGPSRGVKLVIAAAVALVGLWLLFGSDAGIVRVLMLQRRAQELDRKIETLARERAQARERLDRLLNDGATIERVARESYGLARPDEIIFLLPGREGGPSWRAAPAPGALALPEAERAAPEMPLDTPREAQ